MKCRQRWRCLIYSDSLGGAAVKYSDVLAETILKRFPDPDTYPYRSWTYTQGFMLWGFIRLYEKTGKKEYMDYIKRYCDEHVSEDGTVSGFTGVSMDDMMTGSVFVWMYVKTGEERFKLACDNIRKAYDDYPRNSDGGFWHNRNLPGEMWVDGVYMNLMFLTRYGKYIGDTEWCFRETAEQIATIFDCCEKDGTGLLYHGYSENPDVLWAHPITGNAPEIWCEGLGWYAMILVEVLSMLPKDHPGYERIVMQMKKLHAGLAKVQDPLSGLWYQVVDKPRTRGNWHDTSGSAMFLYSFEKARRLGFYENEYDDVIAAALSGIKTKYIVDPEGCANIYDACNGLCIQLDYEAYVRYPRNVNCQEAVAAVFWAMQLIEYGL